MPLRYDSFLQGGAGGGVVGDPYWSNVKLLLGFNGTDGATTWADESPAAHGSGTFDGSCQIDTARAAIGSGALLVPAASGDSVDPVYYADHADWSFGSGEFTIELYAEWDVLPTTSGCYICSHWQASSTNREWLLTYLVSTGALRFSYSTDGSNSFAITSGADDGLSADTVHHLAVTRDSANDVRIFVDGDLKVTSNIGGVTLHNPNVQLVLGNSWSGAGDGLVLGDGNDAWIHDFRLTPGIARYTANFTPDYASFPRSAA